MFPGLDWKCWHCRLLPDGDVHLMAAFWRLWSVASIWFFPSTMTESPFTAVTLRGSRIQGVANLLFFSLRTKTVSPSFNVWARTLFFLSWYCLNLFFLLESRFADWGLADHFGSCGVDCRQFIVEHEAKHHYCWSLSCDWMGCVSVSKQPIIQCGVPISPLLRCSYWRTLLLRLLLDREELSVNVWFRIQPWGL